MAGLNLKQITEKLNTEFAGDVRKLVFWYDANGEFADDVDTLELVNAKVLHLEADNQFYVKYFLECVDTATNYLVYAPFAKPSIRENHLEDTIRYSKEFYADRASLLMLDLGIDARYKGVIQRHIKFFGEKRRTQAFYDLELDVFNQSNIEIGMMCVLCKCKSPSYEEVLRTVLLDGTLEDNVYLAEFAKYDLLEAFWRQTEDVFGYVDASPTLEKLAMSMFVTYMDKTIDADLPAAWQPFILNKTGNNSKIFLDNLMNHTLYGEKFDALSVYIYGSLNGAAELRKLPEEVLVHCGIFAGIEEILLHWATKRLELEDMDAKLGDTTILQLVKMRRQGHFGVKYRAAYFVLEHAWYLISGMHYVQAGSLNELVNRYTDSLYQMDMHYRYFYYSLDKVQAIGDEKVSGFDNLRELVENIYNNEYLSKICVNWSNLFAEQAASLSIGSQLDFYSRNVQFAKEQTVVIISDALRFDVGMTLFQRLQSDEKCKAVIKPVLGVLPSRTQYGMAALLPHQNISLNEKYAVLVDGLKTDTLEQRQAILQNYKPASRCVQYDDIKHMNVADLRSVFQHQDVVYVYHNQIDARGDKLVTENEVFTACEEAVEEIAALIRRLTVSASKSRFIVTADHGFLYKRSELNESDKISNISSKADYLARRYLLAENEVSADGVSCVPVGKCFRNEDVRVIGWPMGADVFKVQGAGMNYVHGGCSPQEVILPLIEVKTERGHKETTTVKIDLVSIVSKVHSLSIKLDFVQKEPISDVVKETTYRVYFVDEAGEKISSEHLYVADKKDSDTAKRIFRVKFALKNQKYYPSKRYYLVAYDEFTGMETLRHEVMIDIPFADDFGFGF
ncbi:MAG: BREX-1 system phosphatase PglZ type A [Peptococcaceae bacterium]|nr:BREX-1 system phosphatase PglZ type A [Peptococcaceae bacterium]